MIPWPFWMATPAESYPRYSSLRSPPTSTSVASFAPTYPTIPHIRMPPGVPDRGERPVR